MEFCLKLGFFVLTIGLCSAGPLFEQLQRHKRSSNTLEFQLKDKKALADESSHKMSDYETQKIMGDSQFNYHHDCEAPVEDPDALVYKRSTCPWVYNDKDKDYDRFPILLLQAELRCNNETRACLGPSGEKGYVCAAINTEVDVMFKNPDAGDDVYVHGTKQVTVGFTCVPPKEVNTQTQTGTTKQPTDHSGIFKK